MLVMLSRRSWVGVGGDLLTFLVGRLTLLGWGGVGIC